ncbi:hypothetical protein [Spongiactinospora sp. 9N601]|uniref:hypothetical protein n=1 Tax=Spongiactinospora sp. 9N601 TaxID=3375149 RepID=UPI0037A4DBF1
MTDLPHIWICAYSEVIRADCVTSFFVAGDSPSERAGESEHRRTLWACVLGRGEPVRIDGFIGIAAADLLSAVTQTIEKALYRSADVSYIRLITGPGPAGVTDVQIHNSYPNAG